MAARLSQLPASPRLLHRLCGLCVCAPIGEVQGSWISQGSSRDDPVLLRFGCSARDWLVFSIGSSLNADHDSVSTFGPRSADCQTASYVGLVGVQSCASIPTPHGTSRRAVRPDLSGRSHPTGNRSNLPGATQRHARKKHAQRLTANLHALRMSSSAVSWTAGVC